MKIIWLSHSLNGRTPLYGGTKDLTFSPSKSIDRGDSCNTSILVLPSHAGTHVDAPFHFVPGGKTVDMLPTESWIFTSPCLIELQSLPGKLINPEDLPPRSNLSADVDLLLIRTGFEKYRDDDIYWANAPGLSPSLAALLKGHFPTLRAIGIDFLSISSPAHSEEGRQSHREFLGRDILIFEDMSLVEIGPSERLSQVIALPLRFANADGAPCSILAWVNGK
jgi:kynurenine formamidase